MATNIPMGLRFSILHRSFKIRIDELLRQQDITGVQFGVLEALMRFERENKSIRQRELEERFRVTHPTMTEILKRLEKKELIVCGRNDADRRSKSIRLSDAGRRILENISELDREVFDSLCEGLSEEQLGQLSEITAIMLKNVDFMKGCDKPNENDT